jgi:acyl-CoA thioester hydrolase
MEDVDGMEIVYHANYLRYLERSRTELLRTYNLLLSELSQSDILFAITDLSIKYKSPARLDDLLTITTEIKELRACTFTFEQCITNQNDKLICDATVKAVCVNKDLKPQRVPGILKELK